MAVEDTLTVIFKGEDRGLSKTASSLTKPFATLGKAVTGAAVAGGAAIAGMSAIMVNAALDFQGATSAIIVGTGASGQALAEMEQIALNLKGTSAGLGVDFQTLGSTIAEVNTRTGLTGQGLEDLSSQILNLSRLTGGDPVTNTQLLTRVMGDWGVATEDSTELLDTLFGAGQAFGIGMEDLSAKVVQFGAPMRQMGFTLEESIALFGKWEKEGVNAELAIGSLRIAAGKFAREGVDLQDGLRDTMEAIKGAATESEGLAIAMDVFGARAGPDMAAAIREGRFELDEAILALQGTEGGLADASERALTFRDRLSILGSSIITKVLPTIQPLMDMFFEMAERAIPVLMGAFESVVPKIQVVAAAIQQLIMGLQHGDPMMAFAGFFVRLASLLPLSEEQFESVGEKISEFMVKVVEVKDQIVAFITPIIEWIGQTVQMRDVLTALGIVLGGVVLSALVSLASAIAPVLIAGAALIALVTAIRIAWETDFLGIRSFIEEIAPQIQEIIMNFVTWATEFWTAHGAEITAIVSTMWNAIKEFFMTNLEAIMEIVRAFVSLFQGDWQGFLEHIGNSLRLQIEAIILLFARIALEVIPHIQAFGEMAIAKFKEIGTAMIDGIANAIRNGAGAIAEAAKAAAMNALNAAKAALGISSPSKVAAQLIGAPFSEGIAQGIVSSAGSINNALASTLATAVNGLNGNNTTTNNSRITNVYNNINTSRLDMASDTAAQLAFNGGI